MEASAGPHKRFICSFAGCPAAYNKQWKLDAHLCKHTGVRPHACGRDGCGKSFCSPYHLARHELTHSGARPFRCAADGCADAFTTNANLLRHAARVHAREQRRYVCAVDGCGSEFRKNKQLKTHVCERHTRLPPYQCAYEGCQMRFAFPSKLKRHEKVHRGYPCQEEGCAFTGKTWTEYLKHRKGRHRVALICDKCSKVFKDSWFLQQHQRVHSEVRAVLRCPRDGCDRSFTTAFNLQSHVSSFHEEVRPFACPHPGCGKTFAMRQSLQRHGVVHDPERRRQEKPRRSKAKRSLASRLSGFSETKGAICEKQEKPEPASAQKICPASSVELVSLLQDTCLTCSPAVDAQPLPHALTAPLTA